jgi:serine/threonine-protein kinase RsbW
MVQAQWTWCTEACLPSIRGAGQRLIHDLISRLRQEGWSDRDIFGVHLALEEALVNAIKHGNAHDEGKRVHVACKVAPNRLWIEIADEGVGFQQDCVPDCTCDERREVPSGRGIMLMRSFMSHVEYNAEGNRVVMEKLRAAG